MRSYVARRLLLAAPVALLVSVVAFMLLRLAAGDPLARLSQQYGLGSDRPLWEQYLAWLGQVLRGDLGFSVASQGEPVGTLIRERLPATLLLDGAALVFSALVSALLVALAASRRGGDALLNGIGLVGGAMPAFVLGPALVFVFAFKFEKLPAFGYAPLTPDPRDGLAHLTLPALTLGIGAVAVTLRQLQARQPGVGNPAASFRTGAQLTRAFSPILPFLSAQVGIILAGTFVVEIVFGWPGIGDLAARAIDAHDYPVLQGVALVVGLGYMAIRLLLSLAFSTSLAPSPARGGSSSSPGPAMPPTVASSMDLGRQEAPPFGASHWRLGRDRRLALSLGVIGVIVALSIIGPGIYQHMGGTLMGGPTGDQPVSPMQYHDYAHTELLFADEPANGYYLLGTDSLGRDLLSRVLVGARASLGIGTLSVAVAAALGAVLAALASALGRLVDIATETLLAFPSLVLAIALVAVRGPSIQVLVIALAIVQVPTFVRLFRAHEGISKGRRLDVRQVGHAVAPGMLAQIPISIAFAILTESALNFLGLGLPAPTPEWGSMVGDGLQHFFVSPGEILGPAVAIGVTVLSLNLLSDALSK